MDNNNNGIKDTEPKKKSLIRVTVHSFFVVPFLIAVFSILLYGIVRILTMEEHTAYDYLNDVKIGSHTKRWQAAFELSRLLAHKELVPQDDRFINEMISAFDHARHDDDRVRQYLALAMGRSGDTRYVEPLLAALPQEKEQNLNALIHALGILQDKRATSAIQDYLDHADAKVRLNAVIALGNIAESESLESLRRALFDPEPNVQWDAAIALAKMKDSTGADILLKLMDRSYLARFPEVDLHEQDEAMLVAIEAGALLNRPELNAAIEKLSAEDRNMRIRKSAAQALQGVSSN